MSQEELEGIFKIQKSDIMDPLQSSFYQFDIIDDNTTIVEHISTPRLRPEDFEGLKFLHYWLGIEHFPIFKRITKEH